MLFPFSPTSLRSWHNIFQVITSCNSTKDELVQEVENFNQRQVGSAGSNGNGEAAVFRYLDHVQMYPSAMRGGAEGSRLATVAFVRK